MKIYIESYGCTLNHGEARYLQELLKTAGHSFITSPEPAETIVLFTCTVIRTTELKMLRRIRYFTDLGKPLIVSGCMAVVQRAEVKQVNPEAYFLTPKEISNVNNLYYCLNLSFLFSRSNYRSFSKTSYRGVSHGQFSPKIQDFCCVNAVFG